jgi:hypothetical protein
MPQEMAVCSIILCIYLAKMLSEELPEHCAFEYTYRAVEGRMAFLEWAYEDRSCSP